MNKFVTILLTLLLISAGANAERAKPESDNSGNNKPVLSGTFVGMSGHKASGGLSVFRDERGYRISFHKDFFFDGAPDPRLGFGKGKYLPATEFAKLVHTNGSYHHRLPESAELEQYSELWIWCEAFSVPIGRVDFAAAP